MAEPGDVIARFHDLLEAPPYKGLEWAGALQNEMRRQNLVDGGRLVAPVLRPHFITPVQYSSFVRAAEALSAVVDKVEALVLNSPALMNRLQLLPAEKVLASVPASYSRFSSASMMDAHLENGSLRFGGLHANVPPGAVYADKLADLFLELPIVKELKKKGYLLSKPTAREHISQAVLEAWTSFGGKGVPNVAVLEMKSPVPSDPGAQPMLAALVQCGSPAARIVSPEQLEYHNGKLHSGDFHIDVIVRRTCAQDLLARCDLHHPLLTAYREQTVCVVNSFRSELAQRLALMDLLTDESVTANLPSSNRQLIRELVPWTRVVAETKTRRCGGCADLPEFILKNRELLVLRPSNRASEQPSYIGVSTDPSTWQRAVAAALRSSYVVQEYVPASCAVFPVYQYGMLQLRNLEISTQPHIFNGKVQGASAALSSTSNGFTSPVALAPVLLVEAVS